MLNQIIWNNQFTRVNKSSVLFPGRAKVGIENLSCLFDNESRKLMTFTSFMQKYNVKSNFLQYYILLSAMQQEWNLCKNRNVFYRQLNMNHLQPKNSHAKQFIILYSITSTSLLQLQRENSLNAAKAFKKDEKSTHFLFVSQMRKIIRFSI